MQGQSRQNNENKNKLTIQIEEDPKIKSKCSTPKKSILMRKDNDKDKQRQLYVQNNYQKTQEKKAYYQKKVKDQDKRNYYEFQKIMAEKVVSYGVVAGTLREYVRQKNKEGKNSKYLPTVISIMKAYAKSQIEEISPNVSELITKMLDTLPIKKSSKSLRSQKQIEQNSLKKHEYSFGRLKEEDEKSKKNIKTQINDLEQNLLDLKQQCQVLEDIRSEFQGMEYEDKQDYIRELEEIVQKQKIILGKLTSVDEEY